MYENGLGAPILWNTTNPYKKNYNDLKSDQIETDS